ncbi:unnamed protein product [Clavelina lepadiformis]|uniref:NXPE C-terminal domain-containing protein n=1 Tax=Clavelina lepadiformis TaxID=159417 RepID=A0ABP0GQU2_CLALP
MFLFGGIDVILKRKYLSFYFLCLLAVVGSMFVLHCGLLASCCFPKFFTSMFSEAWEKSLPGNYETCDRLVTLLLAPSTDEGKRSSEIFSWRTPSFADLILHENKNESFNSKRQRMLHVLCRRYKQGTRTMVQLPVINSSPSLASAYQSLYVIDNPDVKLGDVIRFTIEMRNSIGHPTATGGGDFFKIRAENPETQSSVAASRIVSRNNGIYDVEIKTFWEGRHDVKVFFGQSGHFVDVIKHLTSQRFSEDASFLGKFVKKECARWGRNEICSVAGEERTLCHITPDVFPSSQVLCNFTGRRGDGWFCIKPRPPFVCESLHAVYSSLRKTSLDIFQVFPPNDRGNMQRKTVPGNIASVNVKGNQFHEHFRLSACTSGLKTPKPSGFWKNGLWKSRVCNNLHYSINPTIKADCLRHRTFYFIGDSTARQWYEYFVDDVRPFYVRPFVIKDKFLAREMTLYDDVWEPRSARIEDLNVTFQYRAHGPPLQNGGKFFATRFVSDQLDEIKSLDDEGRHLTVVIAIGPHFLLYNPDLFLARIESIKTAALKLLRRNPLATVIVKGPTTFVRGYGVGECCLSDWLSFRQHKLTQHVFDGTSIVFLDAWDMTVSHSSHDLIHPVRQVVENEIDLALSFSCSEKES